MAIYARPTDTQSGLILMGRVLPSLIKNRVGFGFFKKKKPEMGLGFGKNPVEPEPGPGPDPFKLK